MNDIAGSLLQPVVAPLARMLAPWLLISTKRAVDQLMLAATGPPLQVAYYEHSDCSTAMAFMQDWIAEQLADLAMQFAAKSPLAKRVTCMLMLLVCAGCGEIHCAWEAEATLTRG